jgi:hypothetical protein
MTGDEAPGTENAEQKGKGLESSTQRFVRLCQLDLRILSASWTLQQMSGSLTKL